MLWQSRSFVYKLDFSIKALPLPFVMNKVLISIGSNENSKLNLEISRKMLTEYFEEIRFTEEMETQPYGKQYKGLFLNQLAVAYTGKSIEMVNEITKKIETLLGRKPEHKAQGIVPIDIDIFGWNAQIVRQNDYDRPYVQLLLPQLADLLKR